MPAIRCKTSLLLHARRAGRSETIGSDSRKAAILNHSKAAMARPQAGTRSRVGDTKF